MTLVNDLLPEIREAKGGPLKMLFWACSLGCEPYTIKFLLGPDSVDEIIGIDRDANAIQHARAGVYKSDTWEMFFEEKKSLLTPDELNSYFEPIPGITGSLRIAEPYRKNISFMTGDLFSATPCVAEREFDLVVCNNLLLHLKPDSANRAWDFLHRYLSDKGLLLVSGCNPQVRFESAKRLSLHPRLEKLSEIANGWSGVSGAWNFKKRPAWAYPEPDNNDPRYPFLAGEIFQKREPKKVAQNQV